jgi:hypothetical protein
MSRSAIAIAFVAYFAAALAFAALMETSNPAPSIFMTARIAGTMGGALAEFVLAGILPLLVWAIFRFKPDRARGPMVLWGLLGAVLLYLTYSGETASRKEQILTAFPTSSLSVQGQADFVKHAARACIRRQTDSALNKEVGITGNQIDAYCRCYAESLLILTTTNELRYFAQNGSAPSGYETKVQQAADKCFGVIKQTPQLRQHADDEGWEDVK